MDDSVQEGTASKLLREGWIGLEDPSVLRAMLNEHERAVPHGALEAERMSSDVFGGCLSEEMLGEDCQGPPGVHEIRVGPQGHAHREVVHDLNVALSRAVEVEEGGVWERRRGVRHQ